VVAETKDPQNSRVIIFSNFRGSVRWKEFLKFIFTVLLYSIFLNLLLHIPRLRKVFLGVTMLLFRDIMNTLATIGDLVKATEFIGQSSGL
jgi:Fanconi anemia group M protein